MSVYESILKGLNEAIEYEKGNVQARTAKCTVSRRAISQSNGRYSFY